MDSTIPGKKGPSGGKQELPDVTPLETKKRGIWAEERGVRTGRMLTSFLNKKGRVKIMKMQQSPKAQRCRIPMTNT